MGKPLMTVSPAGAGPAFSVSRVTTTLVNTTERKATLHRSLFNMNPSSFEQQHRADWAAGSRRAMYAIAAIRKVENDFRSSCLLRKAGAPRHSRRLEDYLQSKLQLARRSRG